MRRDQEPVSQDTNRWSFGSHVSRNSQHGLVLLLRQASLLRSGLAKREEAAELVAKGCNGCVLLA